MVHFKVTNGVETRRFQASPGELTFQQLEERIRSLFPNTAATEDSSLILRYRDAEGDVITLSSDEEFQEVLSDLPKDHVWKLHVTSPSSAKTSLRSSWLGFPTETQELIDLLFGLGERHSTKAEEKDQTTATERTGTESEGAKSEPTGPQETTDSEETATPSESSPKEGEDGEVKSKHTKESGSAESRPETCRRYCVRSAGLWDPFLFGGLLGPSTVFRAPAVRYHLVW